MCFSIDIPCIVVTVVMSLVVVVIVGFWLLGWASFFHSQIYTLMTKQY